MFPGHLPGLVIVQRFQDSQDLIRHWGCQRCWLWWRSISGITSPTICSTVPVGCGSFTRFIIPAAHWTGWRRFAHTILNKSWVGWLRPRLHHLHHLSETENRNLGTTFTFWDRLRGTFVIVEASRDSVFGIAGEIETYPQGWVEQLIEPPKRVTRDSE
jgi:sterol desaturase/sphingolipid hydroxylase (fatty acid hydroxylase superfamily)